MEREIATIQERKSKSGKEFWLLSIDGKTGHSPKFLEGSNFER